MALGGLVVGLLCAEAAFRYRDDGGFPRLNVYRADAALGVRLDPGAAQRFVYPDNPSTDIRINSAGYRGAAFPKPGADDVLVVGDSQVFGLGVQERETFSAALGRTLGRDRHVLNGGVPTYGPREYAVVARELIAARKPKTLVFTINMVNDLFELDRPNRDRHTVVDGWAVRRELAKDVVSFPGRTWLARRSHLFYAVRQVWHRQTANSEAASEGTWHDLVAMGGQRVAADAEQAKADASRRAQRHATEVAIQQGTRTIDDAIRDLFYAELSEDDRLALDAGHLQPGDTAYIPDPAAEEGRPVVITARHIRRGAAVRARLRTKLEKLLRTTRRTDRDEVLAALTDEPALRAKLDELTAAQLAQALESPLAPVIREVKALCDEHGVRLVLLILPIDVAVDATEWKKYGATPIDMSSMESLHTEILALGAELGVSTLDATAALRAAEPGAFLDHDIHMTPKGHAAVAAALATTLAAPPPRPTADAGVRAPVPVPAQWRDLPEITVAGSSAARCETKLLREWLRVVCVGSDSGGNTTPNAITIDEDSTGSAMVMVMPVSASLTVAVAPGATVRATFAWTGTTRRLDVTWPAGAAAPTAAFTVTRQVKVEPTYGRRPFASPLERAVCKCWDETYGEGSPYGEPLCPGSYGALDARCEAFTQCADLLACVRRDPPRAPQATAP
jgi:hypothetical protein